MKKNRKTGIEAKPGTKEYMREYFKKYPEKKREYNIKYYYETDYHTAIQCDRKVGRYLRNNDLKTYKQILAKCPKRQKKTK